jgi:hypothetical protein
VFAGNIGMKLNYQYKSLTISFVTEYFKSRQPWAIVEGEYDRTSIAHGPISLKEKFYSKAKTLNSGISIGYIF